MTIEYLLFNLIILAIPILFYILFSSTVMPNKIPAFVSISIAGGIFVFWDSLVTGWFWDFSSTYTIGLKLINLPIEEVMFFITVPFACLFLWVNTRTKNASLISKKARILLLLVFGTACLLSCYYSLWYSALITGIFSGIILLDYILKTNVFLFRMFWMYLGLIAVLTTLFNIYLTWRPIVVYNTLVKTNINIISMPVEDIIYGWSLVAFVVVIYEYISSRQNLSATHGHQ